MLTTAHYNSVMEMCAKSDNRNEQNTLVIRQSEWSGHQQRLFQAFTEDIIIFSLLVYIPHRAFWTMRSTNLLTYLQSQKYVTTRTQWIRDYYNLQRQVNSNWNTKVAIEGRMRVVNLITFTAIMQVRIMLQFALNLFQQNRSTWLASLYIIL